MTSPLSLISANSSIRSIVWLYYAIRFVVSSHTFLWVKIDYFPIMLLTYKPQAAPIVMYGIYK